MVVPAPIIYIELTSNNIILLLCLTKIVNDSNSLIFSLRLQIINVVASLRK